MKQYIIIRNDITVPLGKIMAHIGHNVLDAYLNGTFNDRMSEEQSIWRMDYNQRKIVVITSIDKIELIEHMAFFQHISFSMIDDVKLGYPICAVVGPVTQDEAVKLGLDKLRLYKG